RDRTEATRPGVLQEPLPLGLARRRRSQPRYGTESILVGSRGEAVSRSAEEVMKARVEELIRRAETVDQGVASDRSRTIATGLRSTVLRPLAELDNPPESDAHLESPATGLDESLLRLAMDLTRACADDDRAALLEACAGAHYLVTIDRDDAQERI